MKKWSDEEDKFLIKNYPLMTAREVARQLNRTINSVHGRANKLKIQKKMHFAWGLPCKFWSDDEIKMLREMYPRVDMDILVKTFDRTPRAINAAANRLKIRREVRKQGRYWTAEEEQFVKENYRNFSIRELAEKLDRTCPSVHTRVYLMGMEKKLPALSKVRKEVGWIGPPAPNNEGEEIAEEKFKKLGWKIIERGTSRTPFDYIIERNNEEYLVDVKYGYEATIKANSINRMPKGYKIAYFFISKRWGTYFMPVEVIEAGKKLLDGL